MIGPIKTTTMADMETTHYNNARPDPAAGAGTSQRDGGAARPLRHCIRDGIELPLYRWRAAGTRRATVALLHGLAEHGRPLRTRSRSA